MNSDKFTNAFSLTEEIESILRERILKGEYGIGQRLKENQIAQELKVSRTPIREAFKQLEKEGLIQTIPNRGSFALGLTKRDIRDIYSVRATIEVLAVEWAIDRISDDEIEKLHDVLDLMEFYTKKIDSKKVSDLNKVFHETIYNATGSRFLYQILKSYQEYVEHTRKATVYCTENLDNILKEHQEIMEAIREKNRAKAVECMTEHLKNSKVRAEQSLKL